MNEARERFHPSVTEISTAHSFQILREDVQHDKQEGGPRAGDKIDAMASTAHSFQILREDVQHDKQEGGPRAGDKIDAMARYYINQWNATALATAIRERRLSITEFRHYITKMYPMVVSFNGGLIQSITKSEELQQSDQATQLAKEMQKVDHVRNSQRVGKLAVELRKIAREERLPLLRALAGQLKEEQEHNDYYRKMLEIHGIDHEAYYIAFETYLNGIPIR